MAQLGLVPTSLLPEFWPMVCQRLAEAVDDWTDVEEHLNTIYRRLLNEQAQLWLLDGMASNGVFLTEVIRRGTSHVVRVSAAQGHGKQGFYEALAQFEQWAALQGIEQIEVRGRKGWLRELRRHGFRHAYTALVKDIDGSTH